MAIVFGNLAQHEVQPVKKFIELMREPRTNGSTHILAVTIGNGSVQFSVAAPRGKVIIENTEVDITIKNN